jgi:uncharacterized damage-inducible protein DinB
VTREDPPYVADERPMLDAWLDWHRATVHEKCAGLAAEDAWRSPLPRSPLMTAAGVVSHLVQVERYWFEYVVAGRDVELPWGDDDPDADFRRLGDESLEGVLARYAAQCETSRRLVREVAIDAHAARTRRGEPVSLRHVYVHLIQETARHNGHLDAIRELVDGVVGE